MALKAVTDPNTLAALRQPVSDPDLLAQLNAPEQPAALSDEDLIKRDFGNTVPGTPEEEAVNAALERQRAKNPPPERSWMDDVGDFRILPDFDVSDLFTTIKGAPEVALGAANNLVAAGVAGITAPFVGQNDDDSANYVRDFMAENSHAPQGESAQKLSTALGDAFAPMESGKRALGDTVMDATDSPALATGAYMAPDLATILMGPKPSPGNYATMETRLGPITTKTKPPVADLTAPGADLSGGAPPLQKTARVDPDNPVSTARAAGIKVLPSDVQRVTGKKPGIGDRIAEAIAPEDVRRDMTIDNQGAANQLQREKLGTPEGTRNNRRGIEKQKELHFKTYEEVNDAINIVPPSEDYVFALDEATQRAGFPAGANPKVTEVISALRTKARRKINNPAADDKLEAEGRLADQAADKLEEAMGTELKNTGQEELLTKYQTARQSLGELNDAVKTQRGGNTDPQAVRKLDQKNPGKMTGQTKMLADIAEDLPDLRSSMTGAGKKKVGGESLNRESIVARGAKKLARGAAKITGLGDRLLVESEGFQNRMGVPATASERSYFADYGKKPTPEAPAAAKAEGTEFEPTPGVAPSKSVTLSGRLGLEPEPVSNPDVLPETPDTLTADTIPRSRGELTFTGSDLEKTRPASRDAEGASNRDVLGRENPADDLDPEFRDEAVDRAADLNIDIRTGTKGAVGEKELSDLIAEQKSSDLQVAPREMEQLDFHPPSVEQPRRLQLEPPPGTTKGKATKPGRRINVRDSGEDLGDELTNNASGESSASVEAINRVKQEKEGGRERFVIDLDDTVTPLTGVDAVDRRARKGQVIVQRGVGKDEYTILDRGGLTAQNAKGRIQAAFSRLKESLEPPGKPVTE